MPSLLQIESSFFSYGDSILNHQFGSFLQLVIEHTVITLFDKQIEFGLPFI